MRTKKFIFGALATVTAACAVGCATPLHMSLQSDLEYDPPEIVAQPTNVDIIDNTVAVTPATEIPQPEELSPSNPDVAISGQLDGPTLRIAVRDLAVILDLLGRVEQIDPIWRRELLAELANADGPTAARIVGHWQKKVIEAEEASHVAVESTKTTTPAPEAVPEEVPQSTPKVEAAPEWESTQPVISKQTQPDLAKPAGRTAPSSDELIRHLIHSLENDELDPEVRPIQLQLLQLIQKLSHSADGSNATTSFLTQLHPAIALCLDSNVPGPEQVRRAIRALESVTSQIRGPASLAVASLKFCDRIDGFGMYSLIDPHTLSPGQEVLLYAEIEHLHAELLDSEFLTELETELRIISTNKTAVGETIWSHPFRIKDLSRSKRNDYFISHQFRIPGALVKGHYRLQLFVVDKVADDSTAEVISFSVK